MKKPFLLSLAVLLVVCMVASRGASQRPDEVSDFMRAKLVHSQKVVEGLALENYDLIAKHAQELSLLSQAANWQVLQTPQYLEHSTDFRRSSDALRDAARKKNLDGASLAYFEVTLNCVKCHRYVRSQKMAGIRLPDDSVANLAQ
jgi:hypothetical protein